MAARLARKDPGQLQPVASIVVEPENEADVEEARVTAARIDAGKVEEARVEVARIEAVLEKTRVEAAHIEAERGEDANEEADGAASLNTDEHDRVAAEETRACEVVVETTLPQAEEMAILPKAGEEDKEIAERVQDVAADEPSPTVAEKAARLEGEEQKSAPIDEVAMPKPEEAAALPRVGEQGHETVAEIEDVPADEPPPTVGEEAARLEGEEQTIAPIDEVAMPMLEEAAALSRVGEEGQETAEEAEDVGADEPLPTVAEEAAHLEGEEQTSVPID